MRSQRWSWQAPGHGEPPGEVGLKVVRWFDRHNDMLTDNPASRCHHHHAGCREGELPASLSPGAVQVTLRALIDEYRARVYPVLVGGGIPFFAQRERRLRH